MSLSLEPSASCKSIEKMGGRCLGCVPRWDFYFDSISQIVMDSWTKGRVILVGDAGYSPAPAVPHHHHRRHRAGGRTSQSGLLHHFSSKAALLSAVLEERDAEDSEFLSGDQPHPQLGRVRRPHRPRRAQLHPPRADRTVRPALRRSHRRHHPAHRRLQDRYANTRAWLTDAVRTGQRAGEMHPDAPVDDIVRTTIAVIDGLQQQWLVEPQTMSMVESVLDLCLRTPRSMGSSKALVSEPASATEDTRCCPATSRGALPRDPPAVVIIVSNDRSQPGRDGGGGSQPTRR